MIKINKGQLISYFIFVGIATFFWISTVLNKKSSYTKDIWVKLITPDSLIVLNADLYKANVTLEGKGVDLIFENKHTKNKPLRVFIPPNSKMIRGDDIIKYLSKETSKLNINIQSIIFTTKALSIDKKITRKIPIIFDGKVVFKNLYGLKSNIVLTPTTIDITGPQSYVKKIKKWNTVKIVYNQLSHSIKEKIKLRKPSNQKIFLSQLETLLSIPVEQYTEKKIMLPVSLEGNKQDNLEVLPPYVEVSFLVGLSKFDSISTDDFKANIYLDEDSIKSISYPVSIIDKPKLVTIQHIRPNYVEIYLKNNQE